MAASSSMAAEARGYARVAKELEDSGELERARTLYLKAAKLYNEASKTATDATDRNIQRDLAEHLLERAQSIRQTEVQYSGP
ncbi:MAG TPA: hypothetical protein PKC27_01655, partial [Methanomethylovorans sp.]|nr:hypothetical protein [Methanomethylovorans sp.]